MLLVIVFELCKRISDNMNTFYIPKLYTIYIHSYAIFAIITYTVSLKNTTMILKFERNDIF